jgi:hypothetical protein
MSQGYGGVGGWVRAGVVALAWVVTGCDGMSDAPGADHDAGRDSAGVRIVENGVAVGWPEGGPPSVLVELVIGSADGDGPDVFGHVAALDVDGSGRIYVLDQQAGQVRVFDATGRHVTSFGRPGSGPGELGPGAMAVLARVDGSAVVPDGGNARVTSFGADGAARSWALRLERGVPVRWDRLDGGGLVAQLRSVAATDDGVRWDAVVRYGPDGAEADTLVLLPAGGSVTVGADGLPSISLFQPEPLWDVSPDGTLAWAMNGVYEVRRHTRDGSLAAIIRRDARRRPVTPGDRRALTEAVGSMLLDQGVSPAAAQTMTARMRIAETFPALAAVHVAPGGAVWVQRVRVPSDPEGEGPLDPMDLGAPDWDVFDGAGLWLGTVRLPDGFTLMSLGDHILHGVVRDDLDVQRVVRIRLETR